MLEKLQKELQELLENPPWRKTGATDRSMRWEGSGAPYPGERKLWKNAVRRLRYKIGKQAEEDAKRQINRP